MQRVTAAPDDIVQMHQNLAANAAAGWANGNQDSPSPLGQLSFRLSHLRAAAKTGEVHDTAIFDVAMSMDQDLAAWAVNIPDSWKYIVIDGTASTRAHFGSNLRHVYNSVWAAQTWNNYRTLRILVRQLIVRHCEPSNLESHITLVHELSAEICMSATCYDKSPCKHQPFLSVEPRHQADILPSDHGSHMATDRSG